MSGRWAGSRRREQLPPDWPQRCATVKQRDLHCTWTTNGQRCTEPGTEVDHINRHGGHELTNLRLLCTPHHAQKSSAEGNQARWQHRRARPTEPHPGLQ